MSSLLTTSSWVIVHKDSNKAVIETFSKSVANAINQDKYKAVPILAYLQSLNNKG